MEERLNELDKLNELLESAERELQTREERLAQLDKNLAGKLMVAMMQKTIQKFQGSMEETLSRSAVRGAPQTMAPLTINGVTYVPLAEGTYVVQANVNDTPTDEEKLDEEDMAIPNDSIDNLQTKMRNVQRRLKMVSRQIVRSKEETDKLYKKVEEMQSKWLLTQGVAMAKAITESKIVTEQDYEQLQKLRKVAEECAAREKLLQTLETQARVLSQSISKAERLVNTTIAVKPEQSKRVMFEPTLIKEDIRQPEESYFEETTEIKVPSAPEPAPEVETQPAEVEILPISEVETQPASEPIAEVETQPASEPAVEVETQPASEPIPEVEAQPTLEPAAEVSEGQPLTEPPTEPEEVVPPTSPK